MSRRTARTGRGRGSGAKKQTAAARKAREYADKLRDVQPLVSFQFPKNLRPADKAKLTRYHSYLFADHRKGGHNGITNGVRARVRVKDPAKLAKLQREYGQGELPGIKYVWIPSSIDPITNKVARPKVRHRKTMPTVVRFDLERFDRREGAYVPSGSVETQFLEFDKEALLRDPAAEVTRVATELAGYADADVDTVQFRIRNGENEIPETRMLDSMIGRIRFYMNEYTDWPKWLNGLILETATNQHSLKEYRETKRREGERRRLIKSINIQHVSLLRALEKTNRGRGAMTEVLSQVTTGSLDDVAAVRKALIDMAKLKLVFGDDSRWMLTAHGRKQLDRARAILPLFGL